MTRTGVALVTGAGSGIGRAVTLMLLHEGYDVVLAGRRRHPLEEVAQTGDPDGGHSLCVPTDVGDPGSVSALFDAAVGRFDRLDLLFADAQHARALADAGFAADLDSCSQVDAHPVVPVYYDRQITKLGPEWER